MSDGNLERIGARVPRCRRCPRLVGYRREIKRRYPDYRCLPVPSFGDPRAWLVIVGLAPGFHGANRSGRPFWLDASGEWLYGELERCGLWNGRTLRGVCILNAVKCVPPANRPTTEESERCRPWLAAELAALVHARVVLSLGAIAHRAVLRAWELQPLSRFAFRHGAVHALEGRPPLLCSYHPSRQNTNTGVLTQSMWQAIFAHALTLRRCRATGATRGTARDAMALPSAERRTVESRRARSHRKA
ncbi:MAG: uracil-DNA glycosylase family protein [Myxococcota bacterium]